MCVQICSQMELLKKELRDLKLLINVVPNSYPQNDAVNNQIKCQLSNIIHKHSVLLKMCTEINEIVGSIVFIQFGVSCLIICLTLYQVKNVNKYNSQIIQQNNLIKLFLVC